MIQALNVTVLSNNCVFKKGLLAEHGWSLWIEADDHIFLWDTGQGLAIEHNVRELNLDLRRIEAVLLSHGHYDHTGGLRNVLKYAPHAKIYCHPAVFQPQYRREPGGKKSREIGLPFYTRETLEAACGGLIASAEPVEIISGVWMSGEILRDHGSELVRNFYFDKDCTVPCRVPDDQTLFVETPRGTVLLTACPHAGAINIMHAAGRVTGNTGIYAIFGGFFIPGAKPGASLPLLNEMKKRGVKIFGPAHCTGGSAGVELRINFPGEYLEVYAGSRFSF